MTIYTTENCPQCKFLKQKLKENGISFDICTDPEIMDLKKIKNVPMLELDNGTLLNFQNALRSLDKGQII